VATIPTVDEVLEMLDYADLDITSAHVPAVLTKLITTRICGFIEEKLIVAFDSLAELDDSKFYIWGAGMCLYLEFLSMRGQVHWNSGDVHSQQVGDVKTEYQRWAPMFFFAQGNAPGFYELLPHDSYRMMAFELIRKWQRHLFKKEKPTEIPFGTRSAYFDMEANAWKVRASGGEISWES
jgi:hypothetical protein